MSAKKSAEPAAAKEAAKVVKVALDTVVLSEEQAQAFAFASEGMVSADKRVVASFARAAVQEIATGAVKQLVAPLVVKLSEHRRAVELAAAEAEAQRANAKLDALRSAAKGAETTGDAK